MSTTAFAEARCTASNPRRRAVIVVQLDGEAVNRGVVVDSHLHRVPDVLARVGRVATVQQDDSDLNRSALPHHDARIG